MKQVLFTCHLVVLLAAQGFSQGLPGGRLADGGASIPSNVVTNGVGNFYTGDRILAEAGILNKQLRYDNVKGSPFWADDWQTGALYDHKGVLLARLKVNINLANGKLYAQSGDSLQELESDVVRKVVLYHDAAATNIKAVFVNFVPYVYRAGNKVNDYLQVLQAGYATLLRYRWKEMTRSEGNGGVEKYWYFRDGTTYYLQTGSKIEPLERLSKDELLRLLPGAINLEDWLKEQRLNLRKETDVVRFISRYNLERTPQ